jgi:hypothetical protein
MTARYRQNFLSGIASVTTTGQLTITGTGFPSSIPSNQYMAITLNPGYYGGVGAGEIIYIGPGTTNTVATVLARAQETTAAITGTNIPWVAGPTYTDFDVSNLTATGTLTLSGTGGLTVSGNSYFNNITATGTFNNITVTGTINTGDATISGNKINAGTNGSVTAYQVSGSYGSFGNITLNNGGTISGIPMARISASGQTIISAGYGSYAPLQNLSAATGYGYAKNGCTVTGNSIFVPINGYYRISASIGWHSSAIDPTQPGVYGLQVSYGSGTNFTEANSYLINGSSGGNTPIVPETITLNDLVYLPAGQAVTMYVWNPTTVNQAVGGVAGASTTYLSVSYVSI